MLIEKQMLRAPRKDYMNDEQLGFFRQRLLIRPTATFSAEEKVRQEAIEQAYRSWPLGVKP